jgi:hypothetical protein
VKLDPTISGRFTSTRLLVGVIVVLALLSLRQTTLRALMI